MEHIRGLSFGNSTLRNCSKNQHTEDLRRSPIRQRSMSVRLGGGLAGATFLPASWALVVLENFLAHADGFRRDFHVLVVGNEFDSLLEAQFAVGNESGRLLPA